MEFVRSIRKIDELGRIVLPADIRKLMGLEAGSDLQIEYHDNEIVMKMPEATCRLCGSTKELVPLNHSNVCLECAKKIKAVLDNPNS